MPKRTDYAGWGKRRKLGRVGILGLEARKREMSGNWGNWGKGKSYVVRDIARLKRAAGCWGGRDDNRADLTVATATTATKGKKSRL